MTKHNFSRYTNEMLLNEWTRPVKRTKRHNYVVLKDAMFKDEVYAELKRRSVAIPYVD